MLHLWHEQGVQDIYTDPVIVDCHGDWEERRTVRTFIQTHQVPKASRSYLVLYVLRWSWLGELALLKRSMFNSTTSTLYKDYTLIMRNHSFVQLDIQAPELHTLTMHTHPTPVQLDMQVPQAHSIQERQARKEGGGWRRDGGAWGLWRNR